MHTPLSQTDHGFCHYAIVPVRAEPSDESEIVTQLFFGDPVRILEKGRPWIRVQLIDENYKGWMDFKQLTYVTESEIISYQSKTKTYLASRECLITSPWGKLYLHLGANLSLLSNGTITFGDNSFRFEEEPSTERDLLQLAFEFLNTPYLWGGKSVHGVDCSGYMQTIFKIIGTPLPRDASKQVLEGTEILFEDRKVGDIPFFINSKGIVHHVGILNTKDTVLHASGCVREDLFDSKGIYRKDLDMYTHTYHSIRRYN